MALIKVKDSQGNWTVSPIIAKQDIYSTDEIQVGTWIDGKPIYRKCGMLPAGIPMSTATAVNTNIANANKVVTIKAIGFVSNVGTDNLFFNLQDNNGYISFDIVNGALNITQKITSNLRGGYYVIEYTKTTD